MAKQTQSLRGGPPARRDRVEGGGQATSDLDIYRSANELIEQHGEDVPIHAAMRADELMETGDMDAWSYGPRVIRAANRYGARPIDRMNIVGFRVARTL